MINKIDSLRNREKIYVFNFKNNTDEININTCNNILKNKYPTREGSFIQISREDIWNKKLLGSNSRITLFGLHSCCFLFLFVMDMN